MPPSVSDRQMHLFQMALAMKKGHQIKAKNPAAGRIAKTLSAPKIQEFARK